MLANAATSQGERNTWVKGLAEVKDKIASASRAYWQKKREAKNAQATGTSKNPRTPRGRVGRPRLEAGAAKRESKPRAPPAMSLGPEGRALMAAVSEMQVLRERLGPKLERCVALRCLNPPLSPPPPACS